MLVWMEDVSKEADEIPVADVNDRNKALSEVKSDDNVVGEVPLDLRKLLVLSRRYKKRSAEATTAAEFATEEGKIAESQKVALAFKEKSDLLNDIFWMSIREMFDLWGNENSSLGVKKEWKVVVYAEDDQRCPCPICTLMRLFDRK